MFLPHVEIFIWAMALSFIITLVYRIFTKPEEMRKIKEEMKFYKEKSNEARKRKDMKKAEEYMSEMMKVSQKQFRMNMKPMFVSMIIVIFLLGFVHQAYNGVAVKTNQNGIGYFSFTGFNHTLRIENEKVSIDVNDNGDFSDEEAYAKGDVARVGGVYWSVSPESDEKTDMFLLIRMPFPLPIFGYYLNWLGWYILCTLPATWIFRKLLGVE